MASLEALENFLQGHERSSEEVQVALRQLTLALPCHPPPQIITGEPRTGKLQFEWIHT